MTSGIGAYEHDLRVLKDHIHEIADLLAKIFKFQLNQVVYQKNRTRGNNPVNISIMLSFFSYDTTLIVSQLWQLPCFLSLGFSSNREVRDSVSLHFINPCHIQGHKSAAY